MSPINRQPFQNPSFRSQRSGSAHAQQSAWYTSLVAISHGPLTKVFIAIFSFAMLYASLCSAACAAGSCPNLAHYSHSHDCEQPSPGHSHGSHHHDSDNPDCSKHEHPSSFVLKGTGIVELQLNFVDRINPDVPLINSRWASAFLLGASRISDLSPPPKSKAPIYQQISVLRI